MLQAVVVIASFHIHAPGLPAFADTTLGDAVRQGWQSTAMVLVVGDPQITQEDWEQSAWGQASLAEHLDGRRIRVAYTDGDEDPAACWLLGLDRFPAVVLYLGGEERGRRYGGTNGQAGARELIEWIEAIYAGSSLEDRIRQRVAANPEDGVLRQELIEELHNSGDTLGVYTEMAWFLKNPDRMPSEDSTAPNAEARARSGLLWLVGSLRDRLHRDRPGDGGDDVWGDIEEAAGRPQAVGMSPDAQAHFARLAIDVRNTLQTRVDNGTASERDRFVLQALTASSEELQRLFRETSASASEQP